MSLWHNFPSKRRKGGRSKERTITPRQLQSRLLVVEKMVYFDSSNGTTIGVPDKLMRQLGGKLQVVEKKNFGTFPENPADLLLWNGSGDGNFTAVRGGGRPALKGRKLSGLPVVSVGRADSGETLGFIVRDADEKQLAGFVLDRKQVRALVNYLRWSLQRLKPARGAR